MRFLAFGFGGYVRAPRSAITHVNRSRRDASALSARGLITLLNSTAGPVGVPGRSGSPSPARERAESKSWEQLRQERCGTSGLREVELVRMSCETEAIPIWSKRGRVSAAHRRARAAAGEQRAQAQHAREHGRARGQSSAPAGTPS
eukprot:3344126-Rhodomonas_salina.1